MPPANFSCVGPLSASAAASAYAVSNVFQLWLHLTFICELIHEKCMRCLLPAALLLVCSPPACQLVLSCRLILFCFFPWLFCFSVAFFLFSVCFLLLLGAPK